MHRFETTNDVAATLQRIAYERRPANPDDQVRPFPESVFVGLLAFGALAAAVMGMDIAPRWLWVAVMVACGVAIVVYVWRLDVRDNLMLYEREVTIDVPDEKLRPTVTEGARGEIIRRANFAMERKYWLALYNTHADGRPVTRDGVVACKGMPRDLYHGDAWQPTLRELRRVGLIDNENRMTDEWRRFHAEMVLRSPRSFVPTQNGGDGNGAG